MFLIAYFAKSIKCNITLKYIFTILFLEDITIFAALQAQTSYKLSYP